MAVSDISSQTIGSFSVNMWSGGSSGPPLLFLHGYERHPGGASFLKRLAENHQVRAPEQPGYGSSTGIESVHDIVDLALFYRALVKAWGVGPVDVVGHSTGGMIAAELAIIAPELVRRLVLVNAFGLWIDETPTLDPFGPANEVLAAKWHNAGDRPNPEPTIFVADPEDQYAGALFEAQNRGTATKLMWPIADRGLRRRIGYLEAPTLVLHGASDGLVPVPYAEEMARLIDDAKLHVIEGAGHYPMIEQEDHFISAVESFLGQAQ